MRSRIFLLLLLAMPAFGAYAGDAGYVLKAVDLLDRPAADAKPVGSLTRQQALEVVGRSGKWVNVKAGARSGWLRMIDVRLKTGPTRHTDVVARHRSATDSGIRGFSEEELMVGEPNRIEADKLKAHAVTVKDAMTFARTGNLRQRRQDYLEMLDYMPEGKPPEGFFDE